MTTRQALLLPVGDDVYALPVEWVREVVAAPSVARLVTAPQIVLGLFNLRGQIVVLLNTAALLGIGTMGATAYAVVVNGPHGLAGLATTGFPHRGLLDVAAGASELTGTTGLYLVDHRIAALLDPAVLLSHEHVAAQHTSALTAHAAG